MGVWWGWGGVHHLSCLIRDGTQALAVKVLSPNHRTAREFPVTVTLNSHLIILTSLPCLSLVPMLAFSLQTAFFCVCVCVLVCLVSFCSRWDVMYWLKGTPGNSPSRTWW